jgi:hypothetical protein
MARPKRARASSMSLSLTIASGIKPRRGSKIEDRGSRIENIAFKKSYSAPEALRILAGGETTGVSA